jgi:hypothetical protein
MLSGREPVAAEADLDQSFGRGTKGARAASKSRPKPDDLARLKHDFEAQLEVFKRQQQALLEQQKSLEALKARLDRLAGGTAAAQPGPAAAQPAPMAAARPAGPRSEPARPAGPALAKAGPSEMPPKPVGRAPDASQKVKLPELPRFSDTLGGVLTPRGKAMVEPSFEYAYASNNRVFLDAFTFLPAIAVGLIDIRQVQRHTLIAAGSLRYGITDTWEISSRVPFIYREDLQRSRPVAIGAARDETFTADGSGLGDIEFTTRYQLNSLGGGWPVFVANLSTTIPTGTSPFDIKYYQAQGVPGALFPEELPTGVGYYSVQPSISYLYPSDPAAFFGNLSYSYNAEHDQGPNTYDPGDAIGGSFGMAFSINDKSSFSLGYSHRFIFNSYVDGTRIKGSEVTIGEFLLGFAYRFNKDTSINLSLSLGATSDAQDARLTLRVPIFFQVL